MKSFFAFGAAAAVFVLAGCDATPAGNNADGSATKSASGDKTMPANFKASDACAILDKAVVAEVLKTKVSEAMLGLAHESTGNEAATSECTYLTDAGRASFQARWSPIDDNTADAIKATRSTTEQTMKAFSDKKIEDIPGLGKAAFFVPGINQLNVFIGEDKFAVITTPGGAAGREQAIALAKKIGA